VVSFLSLRLVCSLGDDCKELLTVVAAQGTFDILGGVLYIVVSVIPW
jgi:hypothetical protein